MSVLTVEEALGHPCLRAARVVAGAGGLKNALEAVGVVDVTDLAAVRRNQLLLSSAYPLQGTDLVAFVRQVAARGASALGLKLSGFWPELPGLLVRAAQEEGLPLLVLPEGPFDEIVNPVLAMIADRQSESLHRSADIHGRLTAAALREEGNPAVVAQILADTLGRPAAIVGERAELLAWTGARELWPRAELARRSEDATDVVAEEIDGQAYVLTRVPGPSRSAGAVCLHDADSGDPFVRSSLAHGAVVVGMLLASRRQVEEIYLRFQRELLEDLVDRRLVDPAEATERAAAIGWPLDRPYVVMMVGRPPVGPPSLGVLPSLALEGRSLPSITRALADMFGARLFLRRPGLGLVLHLGSTDDARPAVARVAARLREDDMPPELAEARVAVSAPRSDVLELPLAYREAALTLVMGPPGDVGRSPVLHFADLGPARLLIQAPDPAHLAGAARSLIGPVGDLDTPRKRELFLTLCVLLARNMNVSATASELFFHYNTVRHRLGRLQGLVGGRLETPLGRLTVSLAATAIRMVEGEAALTGPAKLGPRGRLSGPTLPLRTQSAGTSNGQEGGVSPARTTT